MKPSSKGLRSTATTRTNEPSAGRMPPRRCLDFGSRLASIMSREDLHDDAAMRIRWSACWLRDNVGGDERSDRPVPAQVMVFPACPTCRSTRPTQKSVRQARLAISYCIRPTPTVLRNGLAKGDHQIRRTRGRQPRGMVELAKADVAIVTAATTLQPHLRPAEINAYADSAADGRGRRPQYRVCLAALQGAQGQRASTKATTWSSRSEARRRGSSHDQRQSDAAAACSIRRLRSAPATPD